MLPETAIESDDGGVFRTTRWSLILSSLDREGDEQRAREALAQLCRIYWRPIFAFICRHGYSVTDAQDLTQDFFVAILKGQLFEHADPERGRFRPLLLKSLRNFLHDAQDRARARKRGGDVEFVSWDDWMAEAPSRLTIPDEALESWPAEQLFDVRWAATVAERAFRRLQEECEVRGRRRVFDTLSTALVAEREDVSYEELARQLGVGTEEIRRLLHQLRGRYRKLLRAEVAETVADKQDIDGELRHQVKSLALPRL